MFFVKNITFLAAIRFLLLLVQIQIQIQIQSAEALWFYDGVNFTGGLYSVPDGWADDDPEDGSKFCWNVPADFNDRASSMYLQENCVILYEDFACQGRSQTFNLTENPNLADQNFDNIASAFKAC